MKPMLKNLLKGRSTQVKKMYIFVGKNKDADGECRALLEKTVNACGAAVTDDVTEADVIAVLGGDGTIMRAASVAVSLNVPVIGINLGRVGYMAELDKGEIPLIAKYFDGSYTLEERMLLRCKVGKKVFHALNDAVVHTKNKHMSVLEVSCNESTVNEYCGDGVILATPTGSTAYSMSAGGSAIDPRLKCICVTPICPQSPMARPLVFAPDSTVTVKACSQGSMLTVDGADPIPFDEGDVLTVSKSPKKLRMVKLKEDGFYEVLRKKSLT